MPAFSYSNIIYWHYSFCSYIKQCLIQAYYQVYNQQHQTSIGRSDDRTIGRKHSMTPWASEPNKHCEGSCELLRCTVWNRFKMDNQQSFWEYHLVWNLSSQSLHFFLIFSNFFCFHWKEILPPIHQEITSGVEAGKEKLRDAQLKGQLVVPETSAQVHITHYTTTHYTPTHCVLDP